MMLAAIMPVTSAVNSPWETKRSMAPSTAWLHGIVQACPGDQGNDRNYQVADGWVLPDPGHDFGIQGGKGCAHKEGGSGGKSGGKGQGVALRRPQYRQGAQEHSGP